MGLEIAGMQSHCLKHQERVATARCAACSVPLCDLCIHHHQDGKYCSDRCHESAQEGKVRAARLAAQEEVERKRRQTATAIKTIVYVGVFCALFFGWDHLPEGFTSYVEGMWKSLKSQFK